MKQDRDDAFWIGTLVVAHVICCGGLLLVAGLGAGAVGVLATVVRPYRLFLFAAAAFLVGAGLYAGRRAAKACCAEAEAAATTPPPRRSAWVLWAAAAVMLLAALLPWVAPVR